MAKHDSQLDILFTALGDPTRREILTRLARGPATVSELHNAHDGSKDMALPSFMGHLKKLEEAGLITSEKRGRVRSCRLNPGAFSPVQSWLETQRTLWSERLDRFDDYVTNLMKERKNGTGPKD
ncbi:ArsR/SmtB family transcription factor [Celeribacter neptunius]|uniref:Transcriptional regulator, ArsR family n=1 Tax=Celeribacter neptunius TaxID=588602 RepID=A0A1I3J6D7_9RHOB|nr:metalloregulator ArsR/SmtB family transcription factor [Celeribacter neptunius]SFI55455.1 transcriptional regulator, ArsR family [Celeribacter neptunius]